MSFEEREGIPSASESQLLSSFAQLTLFAVQISYSRGELTLKCRLDFMNDLGSIKASLVRELVQATGDMQATAVGTTGGFTLLFRVGESEKTLVGSRGGVRIFASLDTAGSLVRELGVPRFEVDMTQYQAGRLRGPRPDRAEALRSTRTRPRQQPLELQYAD